MPASRRVIPYRTLDRPDLLVPKPRWRGRLHQGAFFAWVPLGAWVVALAEGMAARIGAAVYAVCIAAMYGTSAAFHRIPWGPRAAGLMRRFDHSTIFLAIAGTYTPFALLVLQGTWSVVILVVVWAGAAVGIARS